MRGAWWGTQIGTGSRGQLGDRVMFKIRRGLDVPIAGAPAPGVEAGAGIHSVALLGDDSPGLRPSMAVEVGDRVALGQLTDGAVHRRPWSSMGRGP